MMTKTVVIKSLMMNILQKSMCVRGPTGRVHQISTYWTFQIEPEGNVVSENEET